MCVALKIYSARFPQTSVYTQNQSFSPCHTVTQAVLLNLKNPFSHTLREHLKYTIHLSCMYIARENPHLTHKTPLTYATRRHLMYLPVPNKPTSHPSTKQHLPRGLRNQDDNIHTAMDPFCVLYIPHPPWAPFRDTPHTLSIMLTPTFHTYNL